MTIRGRRMPSFDEVRSLIFPKNGLAKIDSREPVAATSAKLFGRLAGTGKFGQLS
ncbi:hypothetical protein [Kribbella sp. NBC_00359]|uniref:hypothetical protein n=1 Tax=Kribbella sp. NBC_00359 TaxID=2975966 RepID=UPI002E24C728